MTIFVTILAFSGSALALLTLPGLAPAEEHSYVVSFLPVAIFLS